MKFEEALQELWQERKVRRKIWTNEEHYLKGRFIIETPQRDEVYSIDVNDILADDWEIVE